MPETPVLQQYREAKRSHPDALLLFRLGDFYELFFDDAVEAAPILGVTLTSRPLGRAGRAPMCGVPQHAWQSYAGKLLRAGRKVVICDQVGEAGRGLVKREVTRVLTPGTVLEDAYLEPSASNHLVAAWTRGEESGLAACDISTGQLWLCQLPVALLAGEIARWRPAEVLQPPGIDAYRFEPERARERLATLLGIRFPAAIGADDKPLAIGAAGVVLEYLAQNHFRVEPGLINPRTYSLDSTMTLDAATVRNLDIDRLVKLLDVTSTPMGARRLRAWFDAPLRDVEGIELRLGAVAELHHDGEGRRPLNDALRRLGDLERLTSRIAQRLGGARELAALRRSLRALPAAAEAVGRVDCLAFRRLASEIDVDPALLERLEAALVEDPPPSLRDVGAIRTGFDPELDEIVESSRGAREWIRNLEAVERERTGIRSLRVGFNRVFGYFIEVSQSQVDAVPPEYVRKQTLAGGERFVTPELKEREVTVLNAEKDIAAREQEIVRLLQDLVAAHAEELLAGARAVADADALCSLAQAAVDRGWTRPSLDTLPRLDIRAGRHPVVETALPIGEFVPNDILLDAASEQVIVLTGPNMAGKSTFLRQCALIVLMAQCGSFVPAESASIGIVDRVFTRVGAQDDLAAGASTFMVEMTETANILNHATTSSLVVLDEVGRGTSTYDGVSIAQAVVEYLHDRVGARTVFATHYHELTALADRLPRVRNQRMQVVDEDGAVRFLHRVVPGGADRSYGIHVAALAGLPQTLVQRARQILEELEAARPLEPLHSQLALPLQPANAIGDELAQLDLDAMSPLQALQKLHEMRERHAST